MQIILVIAGAVIGAAIYGIAGFLSGGAIGYALGGVIAANKRITQLENRLQEIEQHLKARTGKIARPAEAAPKPEPSTVAVHEHPTDAPAPHLAETPAITESALHDAAPAEPAGTSIHKKVRLPLDGVLLTLRRFFTGGNIAVKVGVIVLFFGVSFLLKYAVEHSLLSVEARLIGSALGGIALVITGWRLRVRRRAYALVLQGGGVGILYLTTFAALRLYALIPHWLAFLILVALAALSAALAVLQDARSMAVLGVSGGFLAPVLTSTGGGNYIYLFSYYAVLNASIMAIAWFRAWRILNVTGFVFTFVIGTMWGFKYYRPEFFSTTEPFLVTFFLMYVAVAVMFAFRRQFNIKGYLDGTLVFGTPVVSFALQSMLVARFEYGMAVSALTLGALYTALAWVVYSRVGRQARLLSEAFLSFGVVFATLAIPLAVDGRWTASAWALEGVAILWAGTRQNRRLARIFGMFLQLGAGAALASDIHYIRGGLPVVNAHFLGCLLISIAGVFSAYTLFRNREKVGDIEHFFAVPLLGWGLLWWLSGGIGEADRHVPYEYICAAVLAFISISCLAVDALERRLEWPWLAYPALGIVPGMFLMLVYSAANMAHPFAGAAYISWAVAFASCYRILYAHESVKPGALNFLHAGPVWLISILLAWEISWQVNHFVEGSSVWPLVATGVVPAVMGLTLPAFNKRLSWPFAAHPVAYLVYGLGPVVFFAWLWCIFVNLTSRGNPWPLDYIPLVNPLDVAVGFVLAAVFDWHRRARLLMAESGVNPLRALFIGLYGASVFLWLNAVVVRTVHYWGGVSFSVDAMMGSVVLHASLSICWSVLALGTMVYATRNRHRAAWMAGAVLLGAVVVKLFSVDLSKTGTVARIVSFVVVGLLLLVVGYFTPVPPKTNGESKA